MAVAPLFVASMTVLRARLRLTGAALTGDAQTLIDGATQTARVGFYQRLGRTRVVAIVAMNHTDNPDTADEVTRTQAELAEIAWVRCEVLPKLLNRFVDGGNAASQQWNDQAAALGVNSFAEYQQELRDLKAYYLSALDVLSADEVAPLSIRSASLEPDNKPDRMAASAFPNGRNPANHPASFQAIDNSGDSFDGLL